jgi:iron-sulfur cluster assembly accessory protein
MTVLEATDQIILTPEAAQAVSELLTQRNLDGYSLRVFVQSGGCSGIQYGMALDNRVLDTDLFFDQHGVRVMVDEVSIQYLKGATVDYVDDVNGSGFKISNPNAISTCGCGQDSSSQESGSASSCGCSGCQ